MVSARVPEIDGWGNLVCSLVGILGISPSSGEGLGMPFFFSSTVAHRAAPTRPSLYPSLVFSRPIQWDDPLQCGCRMRKIMQHCIGLAVVVWLLAIGWTTSSWALTAIPRTFAELVGLADWVFIGTVTQVTSAVEAKGTRIYTYVTLADLEMIKGEWHDSEYVLRVSGGVVDQRGEVYPGFPQFEAGRRYILFIQGNFSALFPVVGLHQGVFRVEWDPARQQTVVWPLSEQMPAQTRGGSPLGQSRQSLLPAASVTVEAFVQRIRAQLRILSQEGPGAGNAGQPGGLSHER
jgi:hypothetical protein